MTAALELQTAIVAALRQSSALTGLLGGAHVYDDVPDSRRPPYVVIGPLETVDWSTSTEEGEEHFIEITAWSQANGRKQAVAVTAEQIATAGLVVPQRQVQLEALPPIPGDEETSRDGADVDRAIFPEGNYPELQ